MLTYEEDVAVMITFTLAMYECKLSINLHQWMMKVATLIQIRVTIFLQGILGNSLWYWFKCKLWKVSICHAKWFKVSQG
jgi:hypothetical protein